MTRVNNPRPDNLMPVLLEVRDSGRCSTLEFSCVVDTLKTMSHEEVAAWLESHEASYDEIVKKEFSGWLKEHSPYEEESIAQDAAAATGLGMPEDSFS
ncbi:MAG: hypothetical protein CLLPBCKN_008478 [Chroococcidiopsis cubana SAG 39.79]|uniref:DUF5069 domain-containing protein n=1 Tax=Chroococcidiopsis cubana SAG 39.79 TaxID=388085 RepID=A0AB37U995_9CYAN|nr:hypothetical protein [Chroococcidiopsis cubana]MDZ4879040.1 hypothetical protein [Chroococcidiopsis cubana SAG 39.79]RUT00297.1 hypothetical protein DSM107010_68150 [Chroococcidiopsis cubana SAG 39.79]